ncbi:MAG TPA: DUF4860 domain-containing protein [Lachnospiraceae bacterium]|jgi:hypothetical protein|nr:DUF4860 domain-containing protein [Lachnospiraceae bacterium]
MNIKRSGKHTVDILFILALFGAFIVSALLIVVLGARVYQNTVDHAAHSFTSRTSLAYVTEKIRQHDEEGAVSIAEVEGQSVLRLSQKYGDTSYYTYLYDYDGYLKELTVEDFYQPALSQGQDIIPINELKMNKVNDSLYSFKITDTDDNVISFFVSIYSENQEVSAL